jgi:hypothetical protein
LLIERSSLVRPLLGCLVLLHGDLEHLTYVWCCSLFLPQ